MSARFMLAAITCPALMACSTAGTETQIPGTPTMAGEKCNADSVQSLVGQKATAEIGADALAKSGSRTLRWIPPNSAVTMDFRQDRLNIDYDDKMVITRIHCG